MAELAKARTPFIETLVSKTVRALQTYAGEGFVPPTMRPRAGDASQPDGNIIYEQAWHAAKEYHYNQCLNLIRNSGVMAIESDAVFEDKAKGVMIRYLEDCVPPDALNRAAKTVKEVHLSDTGV